jgi:hypothetical protein
MNAAGTKASFHLRNVSLVITATLAAFRKIARLEQSHIERARLPGTTVHAGVG